jgi:hypothetical protein
MRLRTKLMAIISEIALWGLIGLVLYGLAFVFLPSSIKNAFRHRQTIVLQFNDASQVAVGSPVNFMGTDVGFVSRVQPRGDKVEVELKTYPDAVPIPEGAHFTVEFNGLAGAKTLEVLPPTPRGLGDKRAPEGYIVDQPIRMRDVMKTQMTLAEALESSSNNFAHSLGHVDQKTLIDDLQHFNQRLLEVDRTMVFAYATLAHKTRKIHLTMVNASDSIGSFQMMLDDIGKMTDPAFFKTNTMSTLRYFTKATENTYHTLTDAKNENRIHQFDLRVTRSYQSLANIREKLSVTLPRGLEVWCNFNGWLCRTDGFLRRVNTSFQLNPPLERLHRFRDKTQKWSQFKLDF